MVNFGRTLLREHNCLPDEFSLIWDYVEHFKVVKNADGTISRYYSKSAFKTAGDEVKIIKN